MVKELATATATATVMATVWVRACRLAWVLAPECRRWASV